MPVILLKKSLKGEIIEMFKTMSDVEEWSGLAVHCQNEHSLMESFHQEVSTGGSSSRWRLADPRNSLQRRLQMLKLYTPLHSREHWPHTEERSLLVTRNTKTVI